MADQQAPARSSDPVSFSPLARLSFYWYNLPIRHKGAAVIVIPVACLLICAGMFAWLQQNIASSAAWVFHSQQVRLEAQQLQSALVDAETSVLGYDITLRKEFLDPYRSALVAIPQSLDRLRELVRDNPVQSQRVAELQALAGQKIDQLTANVVLVNQHQSDQLPAALIGDNLIQGKPAMDQLRQKLTVFVAEEERLQRERDQQLASQESLTLALLLLAALIGVAGGVAAAYLFSSGITRRLHIAGTYAQQLARGDYLLPPKPGHDELSALKRELYTAGQMLAERERLLREKNIELAEQNQRAEEATRLKSEFLANMSHELRTPLNGIIGFAELMHDGKVGPVSADHQEFLGDILTSSRHLLQLINDILDLSKVESGKMEFRPEPIELAKVVGEVRDILRTMAARKRIRIEAEIDPAIAHVVADPSKLKQVLYNYLSNALKFTHDEGHVRVLLAPDGPDMFRLEVHDDGIGISPDAIDKLFAEFTQLDDGMAKKYQGTGLGLALTKRIVEAQGGSVGVRSAPGLGSTFFALLPRVAAPDSSAATDSLDPAALAHEPNLPTILVVEDEPQEQAWLARTISAVGFRVELASTGAEAIAKCKQQRFAAITLDLLLPDMGGWDVLRAARQLPGYDGVPVIVATVVAEREVGVGFPIHDFLVKPVQASDLLNSLTRAGVIFEQNPAVLVVDDDPAALKIMAATLRQLNVRPICCSDGSSGLHAAEAEPPAAVVLDLLMPGMDGFEFLRRLRSTELGRHLPVIIWTNKDLTSADRLELDSIARAIVLKNGSGTSSLIEQLQNYLPLARPARR